jgi:DNA-binding transcriptional LysR family regulator
VGKPCRLVDYAGDGVPVVIDAAARRDLLEILEDRYGRRSIHAAQIFDVTMFANTNVAVRAAVESGGGFTILPDFAVRSRLESGSLIRLLDKWSLPSGDIQAVTPAGRHQSAVARMLFSSLQTLLRQAAK